MPAPPRGCRRAVRPPARGRGRSRAAGRRRLRRRWRGTNRHAVRRDRRLLVVRGRGLGDRRPKRRVADEREHTHRNPRSNKRRHGTSVEWTAGLVNVPASRWRQRASPSHFGLKGPQPRVAAARDELAEQDSAEDHHVVQGDERDRQRPARNAGEDLQQSRRPRRCCRRRSGPRRGARSPARGRRPRAPSAANRTFGSNQTTGNRNMKRPESISSANERDWPW